MNRPYDDSLGWLYASLIVAVILIFGRFTKKAPNETGELVNSKYRFHAWLFILGNGIPLLIGILAILVNQNIHGGYIFGACAIVTGVLNAFGNGLTKSWWFTAVVSFLWISSGIYLIYHAINGP